MNNIYTLKLKSILDPKAYSLYPNLSINFKPEKEKLDFNFEKDKFSFSASLNEMLINSYELKVL